MTAPRVGKVSTGQERSELSPVECQRAAELAQQAPPLSVEQRERLRALLQPGKWGDCC
jgi:hypothetical protein